MRKKALLIGASSPFKGPWVSLEEGLWLIEPNGVGGGVQIRVRSGANSYDAVLYHGYQVYGPCRVRAVVLDGYEDVHLDARQIAHA